MKKRAIITTSVMLLAGAVVNMLVGWVLIYSQRERLWITIQIFDNIYPVIVGVSLKRTPEHPLPPSSSWLMPAKDEVLLKRAGRCLCYRAEYLGSQEEGRFPGLDVRTRVESGWPMTASATRWKAHRSTWHLAGMDGVPCVPVWPGFAVNTLMFGGVLWALFVMPGVLKRIWRKRNGLCVQCGYELRGTAGERCPECGWKRC